MLSVVSLEYHSLDRLDSLLESIGRYIPEAEEIIVVSNSCYSEEKQRSLPDLYPQIVWLFSKRNGGFAAGVQQGLEAAHGDLILYLNMDVSVLSSSTSAIRYLQNNSTVGILGPQIENSRGEIHFSFRKFMTLPHLLRRILTRLIFRKARLGDGQNNFAKEQDVDWIIGGAFLTTASALKQVGQWDSKYFLYVEDMDWCYRCWASGLRVVYFPEWRVEFEGDQKSARALLSGRLFDKYLLIHIRSYMRFCLKFGLFPRRHRNTDLIK